MNQIDDFIASFINLTIITLPLISCTSILKAFSLYNYMLLCKLQLKIQACFLIRNTVLFSKQSYLHFDHTSEDFRYFFQMKKFKHHSVLSYSLSQCLSKIEFIY